LEQARANAFGVVTGACKVFDEDDEDDEDSQLAALVLV